MNYQQMTNMYARQNSSTKQIDENELIDISSDSDEASNETEKKTPNNITEVQQQLPAYINDVLKRECPSQLHELLERGKKRKLDESPDITAKKKRTQNFNSKIPSINFDNLMGIDNILCDLIKLTLHLPAMCISQEINYEFSVRGILLYGPPRTGKTTLARALAGELKIPILEVMPTELVKGISGESEEVIRDLFNQALSMAPCIIFIDEIDAIGSKRNEGNKGMENRIVSQILKCLDDLSNEKNGDTVLVLAATNRPECLDEALRSQGRFDQEIYLGPPDRKAREKIIESLMANKKKEKDFDCKLLAKNTPGYVIGDLVMLVDAACRESMIRILNGIHNISSKEKDSSAAAKKPQKPDPEIVVDDVVDLNESREESDDKSDPSESPSPVKENDFQKNSQCHDSVNDVANGKIADSSASLQLDEFSYLRRFLKAVELTPKHKEYLHSSDVCLTMEDFTHALKRVQPRIKREGFVTEPNVTWDDVGSLRNVREALEMSIMDPVKDQDIEEDNTGGILLFGPPGCGKTLIAKAIATEKGFNFMEIRASEILNKYVGESEKAVRECFKRARLSAPCIMFFDEFDALCPRRGMGSENGVLSRLVNQFLLEMDGFQSRQNVFILAATNRPDVIDPAVLRPGRIDKSLYVGLPTASDRADILRALTKNGTHPRFDPEINFNEIALLHRCEGLTGADLKLLVKESNFIFKKDTGENNKFITLLHVTKALSKIKPSVSEKDRRHFEELKKKLTAVEENEVEEMEYS